jgi:hypothetical protein
MKKQLVATLIIVSIPFLFASCVSTLLKGSPPTFSKEISLSSPGPDFTKTDTSVFPSWKNSKTGNVISIVSDCSENAYYSLSSLHQLIESSLEDISVVKEENISLLDKAAFSKTINAELDGSEIEVQSVSFKRKSCGYVASLSGKRNNLAPDQASFQNFLNGFKFE